MANGRGGDGECKAEARMGISLRTAPFRFLLLVGLACSAWCVIGLEWDSEWDCARGISPSREFLPGPPLIIRTAVFIRTVVGLGLWDSEWDCANNRYAPAEWC